MSRWSVLFAYVVGACGGKATTPSGPAEPEAPAAHTHTPAPVPAGYVETTERTRREGRAALGLFVDDKLAELEAKLTPELAKVAPMDVLAKIRSQMSRSGPLARGDDAVFLMEGVRAYVGDVKVGEHVASASVSFDDDGRISGLTFTPRPDLPADPHAGRPLKAHLRLPFDGQWWVMWGGDTATDNYHVIAPDQRHAYDIVMWKDGGTHAGDGKQNEDYYCWGQPIVAPADATVTEVENGAPDNAPGVMDPEHKAGNHVVLDLGNGEHALIAHMQQGSVLVKAGDKVTRGQRLGLTGNSGNTTEPHVHFHVQDDPTLFEGAGVPVWFDSVCTDGKPAARTSPLHGEFIEACD
jgi:murein DD-endopeptidase MepM/ murein hydrolase activator NlpD